MESAVEAAWRERLKDALLRRAAEEDGTLSRDALTAFPFEGEVLRLVDESRGIRNPKGLETTLTITHNPDGPYADREISPGVWSTRTNRARRKGRTPSSAAPVTSTCR